MDSSARIMDTTISDQQTEMLRLLNVPGERITMFVSEADAEDAADAVAKLARFAHTRLMVAGECDTLLELPVDQIEEILS